ncbi:uncharacterized protein LOC101851293 [Aplysia californica]|uniref:Uncharacterized protein LOC101851293 n=1 Tax=Aplysia californica TaxID=6500 RepID=A0ABM0K294_APLCA|nr:uncharacterized protein LOC101851293 [Aplysia californica]
MKTPQVGPCTEIWRTKLDEEFCSMTVATLFKATGLSLIVGCEDGMVRVHDFSGNAPPAPTPQTTLETKSGPIQCLVVHDVTRFYHNDLIVGDSCGMLTVFCNKQILSRQSLSAESLICVTVIEDNAGSPVIVSSDDTGVITGVQPTEVLWRINLNSLSNKNPSLSVKVTCLLSAQMTDPAGNKRQYILAADNAKRIHLISNGTVVSSLVAPSNITAMTQGRFIPSSKLNLPSSNPSASDSEQVALAGANGAVYIMHNFNVTLDDYVNAKSPITNLCTVHQPDQSSDLLLCAGNFSSLHLYRDGQLLTQFPTNDWVSSIATVDINGDGALEVVIGCMDSTVMALKL